MFPSPTGVLYLLIFEGKTKEINTEIVSVPYWGSLSSNCPDTISRVEAVCQFPSPTGVLYLLINQERVLKLDRIKFPSPTGVLYLLMKCTIS